MSGFAGYTNYKHTYKENEAILNNMLKTMLHRGPDSKSEYNDTTVHMGIRHNDYGNPIAYHAIKIANYIVVFDGVIYNAESLWNSLSTSELFTSEQTTEALIINMYHQLGKAMVSHLNGMFAFVIFNTTDGSFFGAKDRFGSKPLYYTCIDGEFLFASEIKALLKHPDYKASVNKVALKDYLSNGYRTTSDTIFSNIYAIPAAHTFTYKSGKLSISRYWKPTLTPDNSKDIVTSATEINTYLTEAVNNVTSSYNNCGTLLTKNLAGNLITAISHADDCYSVHFDFDKTDEINYITNLSNSLRIDNHGVYIATNQCMETLPDMLYHMDEPISDEAVIQTYFICNNASNHTHVALSGTGGSILLESPDTTSKFDTLEAALMIYDKLGMAHSLEVRMPYLNNNFFDMACTVPSEYKTNKLSRTGKILSKNVLRQASVKHLPNYVTDQQHTTRQIPLTAWLRNERYYKLVKQALMSDVAKEYLNQQQLLKDLDAHKSYKADKSETLWRAYIFLVWYKTFFNE